MPVKILLNVERSEALALLDEEGTLLVMCSLIDNMPYVLAEAAVGLRPGPIVRLSCNAISPCSLQALAIGQLRPLP